MNSGQRAAGPKASTTRPEAKLTIAQLEANYEICCKALRKLIEKESSLQQIKRTVCWDRLHLLHRAMPRQYRDPLVHYNMIKRAVELDRQDKAIEPR